MTVFNEITARLEEVQRRIVAAAPEGRKVTIVAVTKRFDASVIADAQAVGLRDFGENYAQELLQKASHIDLGPPGESPERWHFIGQLQRNKIKKLAPYVSVWHTIDRPSLLTELSRRVPAAQIFIQVNTTGEPQKAGCDPEEAEALVGQARDYQLEVLGLMTMGPSSGADPRPAFAQLRQLGERCETTQLSMGMSGDYDVAVAEGATVVRIGTALFGPRSTH